MYYGLELLKYKYHMCKRYMCSIFILDTPYQSAEIYHGNLRYKPIIFGYTIIVWRAINIFLVIYFNLCQIYIFEVNYSNRYN